MFDHALVTIAVFCTQLLIVLVLYLHLTDTKFIMDFNDYNGNTPELAQHLKGVGVALYSY